ncbi:MAG: response regulator [Oscillospiraceae bacterium]|nr:response regulator [Oscillospiraceae bacterium]
MINRERLYFIRGLNVSGIIDKMSDRRFEMYIDSINSFIDRFPMQADLLHEAVENQAKPEVITEIFAPLCDTLTGLHATEIVADYCTKIETLLKAANPDYDSLEAVVENFIHSVNSLSIDIQIASHGGTSYAPSTQWQTSHPSQPQAKQTFLQKGSKILAVDNAVLFLNTLKKMMENSPYDLFCTTSCADAMEYARNEHPDLILLDIEMPEMDGYDLAGRIKQDGCMAPIIFITANSEKKYIDKAVEVGAVGLLMKPLRSKHLMAKLEEFV